jgi:hypothetical protein
MVAISLAPIAGLMMVNARITNPILKPEVFNKWYSEIHVRDMVNNNFATVAVRYSNYSADSASSSADFTLSTQYLALYNVPDINFIGNAGNMNKLPLTSDMLPEKNRPVTTWSSWTFTYWLPLDSYEGKSNATERPKCVIVEKIEPSQGGDEELDRWYKEEV